MNNNMDEYELVTSVIESVSSDIDEIKKSNDEISNLEEQLNDTKNQLQFAALGSITRPTLESKESKLQKEIDDKKQENKDQYAKAQEKFESSKSEFIRAIDHELDLCKPKAEIEQAKKEVQAEKESWTKILEINREKMKSELAKMNDEGNYTDANSLNSYKQKIANANEKLKEIGQKEYYLSNVMPIEDNIKGIQALEQVKMIYEGMKLSDLFDEQRKKELKDKIYDVYKINDKKEKETEQDSKQEQGAKQEQDKDKEPDNESEPEPTQNSSQEPDKKAEPNTEPSSKSEPGTEPKKAELKQELDSKSPKKLEPKVENKQEVNSDSKYVPRHFTSQGQTSTAKSASGLGTTSLAKTNLKTNVQPQRRIKGIIIDKYGIKIKNNEDKGVAFNYNVLKENLKMSGEEKRKLLSGILELSNADATSNELIDKMDPNVLFALQKANSEYGVDSHEVKSIVADYMQALDGNKAAQMSIRGLITYDRTRMDYLKPRSALGILLHKNEYKQLKEYQQSSKDFTRVINDLKVRTLKDWFYDHSVKKLQDGAHTVSTKVVSVKEKGNKFRQDLREGVSKTGAKEIGEEWKREEKSKKQSSEKNDGR